MSVWPRLIRLDLAILAGPALGYVSSTPRRDWMRKTWHQHDLIVRVRGMRQGLTLFVPRPSV